jgi:hypothetical protein
LNKNIFDQYANRFQLFGKGDSTTSVFSSEEFIYQYILNEVNNTNFIKVHDIDIFFESNGYLTSPTDILFLEKILGETALLDKLGKIASLTDDSIEHLFDGIEDRILYDEVGGFLISDNEIILIEKFSPKIRLSYLDVLKNHGLEKLETVLTTGFVKI